MQQPKDIGNPDPAPRDDPLIETMKDGRGQRLDSRSKKRQCKYADFWREQPRIPSRRQYNLTIAVEPRLLWFRNAKVGTRSTLRFLDEAGVRYVAKQPFKCFYEPDAYADHFKFAFVRNPWARLVSAWENKVARNKLSNLDEETMARLTNFEEFVDYCATVDLDECNAHFRRQSRNLDLNNIDFVGRLENFEADLQSMAKLAGLKNPNIPRLNARKNSLDYRTFYDNRTRDLVGELFRRDIQIFGYSF